MFAKTFTYINSVLNDRSECLIIESSMKKIVVLLCSCFLMTACVNSSKINKEEKKSETVADMHNAENSLDVDGIYTGTFPAADCPGIETTLTLNKDNTFTLHSVYIDRKDGTFDDKGTYTLDKNLLTLKVDGDSDQYYKVGENKLFRLDSDKREITGPLAEHYILTKE